MTTILLTADAGATVKKTCPMKTYSTKSNAIRAAKAIGLELTALEFGPTADGGWTWTPTAKAPEPDAPATDTPNARRRPGEAVQKLLAMLRRPDGASVNEIVAEIGWLPHTTRARISATVGKAMGYTITTEKIAKRGRVYRAAKAQA